MSLSGTKPYYFKSLRMSFSAARLFLFVWTSTSLSDVARDGDGDQIEAADTAVRWIEGDPARARHIDFRPGMSRPRIFGPHNVLIRIVKIAGDDPCPETDTARTRQGGCVAGRGRSSAAIRRTRLPCSRT